jgi:hypothetical protein
MPMIYENVIFSAEHFDRLQILEAAEALPEFNKLTLEQKAAFVKGKSEGFHEGRRRMAQEVRDNFCLQILGFNP